MWVGNPNAASYTGFYGGDLPAALWASFMRQATAGLPEEDWPAPDLGAFRSGRCVGGCSSGSGSGSGGGTVLQGGGVGLGGND